MEEYGKVENIIDFAINEEISANKFYLGLAAKMTNPVMRKVFEDYAAEELGHKAKLEDIKKGKAIETGGKIIDLKISDFAVDAEPSDDMDYQDALILAMKKEKAAFKLYSALAELEENEDRKKIFLKLAQEEAKHKMQFEIEYDDEILKKN